MIGRPWRVFFFGSDAFSLTCLRRLNELLCSGLRPVQITGIVPIAHSRLERELSTVAGMAKVDPEKEEFDVGIVASYGKFIPRRVIRRAGVAMLNVHPSLLPEWRGPAPIQRSIMTKSTLGVSIIDVHPKVIDSGDVYMQRPLSNAPSYLNFTQASDKLAVLGAEMLLETLGNFDKITPVSQEGTATYAAPITRLDSLVRFREAAAEDIYRKYLAISHQETLRCQLASGRELYLKDLAGFESLCDLEPGKAVYEKRAKVLRVGTKAGVLNVAKAVIKGKSTVLSAGGIVSALKELSFL